MRRAAAVTAVILTVTLSCAACGGSSSAGGQQRPATVTSSAGSSAGSSSAAAAGKYSDWPTYHRSDDRAGRTSATVTPPLRRRWAATLDGAVYGDPLVVAGKLIVATENDTVYELDPKTGKQVWKRHLGTPAPMSTLPCGDIDPLGITGTPAYDATTGSVFVVAETTGGHHTLWALRASTGGRRWHRNLDVEKSRSRKAEQERSALLVTHNRVITTFGGLAGDCSNYVGYVTSVATTGKGKTASYAVPTQREAGMWSPAGPVTGTNGNIYTASGNGSDLGGKWDKSDSVTELTPTGLKRVAVFAPSTWPQDNQQDLDLGSSSPVPVHGRIVIAGKRGTVYLVKKSLGGVGKGLAEATGCQSYGGAARHGDIVYLPCHGGIRALNVGRHSLKWSWTATNLYGSPVIAGNRVYLADRDSGELYVLSRSTGKPLDHVAVGTLTHFPSEVVDGGRVFVPTTSGVVAFSGS